MIKRLFSAMLLLGLVAASARASLRSPQIPVSGTALQAFFTEYGQAINVDTDQLDLQVLSLPNNVTFQIDALFVGTGPATSGIYNAGLASPPLYQVFPSAVSIGWYAVFKFHTSPLHVLVNLFDAGGVIVGTNSYLGADPSQIAFYLQLNAGGTFYSEDARNGGARMLAFNAPGYGPGAMWLAWETGPGPGGDFADSIWLIQDAFAPFPVPVMQTSWGALKQRFR